MPLLKVLFTLNMLSSNVTSAECHLIWNCSVALELANSQARCHSSTASICHMQPRMNAILRLGPPCSVHKCELYMLEFTATCAWSCVQQLGCKFRYQEKTHWHVVAKEPVTDHMSAGASQFLFLLFRGMYHRLEWADVAEVLRKRRSRWKIWCRLESICTAPDWYRNFDEVGQAGTLQRYQVTITSKKDISERENSSITFIFNKQAEVKRGSKLLGQCLPFM